LEVIYYDILLVSLEKGVLIDGAADPSLEQWGMHSGINSWPDVAANIKPTNSSLRLYGGVAYEQILLLHKFWCATYSIESHQCP
jgi:hypothetical protein